MDRREFITGTALASGAIALPARGAQTAFEHTFPEGAHPWTSERFLDDPQEFHFAIVSDRTGGERPGFFGKAMDILNLLRPEFVMSVGDLIAGGGVPAPKLRAQWEDLRRHIAKLEMPFFHVVGNHDIWTGFTGMSPARQTSIDMWKEYCGPNTYYDFVYKRCHFVCLDSMDRHDYYPPREPVSPKQLGWAASQIERHADARWHFLFIHKPLDFTSDTWMAFERHIAKYDFCVFCGDWHNHCTATRLGKKYYLLGTTGGGYNRGGVRDDLRRGDLDAVTWVTMTRKGPVISNIALSGVYGDTIQTCATTEGWIEAPLDYPSHRAENPLRYANERNTALIPAEVMVGPGYDWHFRHAVILRQGRIHDAGIEKFKPNHRRVVLLGDETASARAKDYGGGWQVFDLGFPGDRVENVLWRVIEGELFGYDPDAVVISAGAHNRERNTPEEIAAGLAKLTGYVRAEVPRARIIS